MNLEFLPAIVPVRKEKKKKTHSSSSGRVILAQFNYQPLFAQPGLTNGLITGANIGAREGAEWGAGGAMGGGGCDVTAVIKED